jgi:hypothetical protein
LAEAERLIAEADDYATNMRGELQRCTVRMQATQKGLSICVCTVVEALRQNDVRSAVAICAAAKDVCGVRQMLYVRTNWMNGGK